MLHVRMKQRPVYILMSVAILIITVLPATAYILFPNTADLIISLVKNDLPDIRHIVRIRENLLSQKGFVEMLAVHEKEADNRFRQGGLNSFVKKYVYATRTSMFDLDNFHDYWEVWVRTDVVAGSPYTSFLVRLGMIKDENAEKFFSDQCVSGICRHLMQYTLRLYNRMFDWNIFRPVRLNITESDRTSGVGRERLTLKEWNRMVNELHSRGDGVTYANGN